RHGGARVWARARFYRTGTVVMDAGGRGPVETLGVTAARRFGLRSRGLSLLRTAACWRAGVRRARADRRSRTDRSARVACLGGRFFAVARLCQGDRERAFVRGAFLGDAAVAGYG